MKPPVISDRSASPSLAIMQPYFLPYVGYFQLLNAVDTFVVYDNIKYTKKGWINRNRFLRDRAAVTFSIPISKASDHLAICERQLAESFDREKLLRQFESAYRRAPFFRGAFPLIERIIECPKVNLFDYVYNSLCELCGHLAIDTRMVVSSTLDMDHSLRGEERVLETCRQLQAETYVNVIAGQDLYSAETFAAAGIKLQFLEPALIEYDQMGKPFAPGLSIVDVLMFNSLEDVTAMIRGGYQLV